MSAQLEDGYTQIAHELLEALSKTRINGTQANIVFFILRYTYGFHRKCHELGNSFIAEGTAIRKDQVKRELNQLIEMKIIKVYEESTHIKSRVIGINTSTQEWTNNTKRPQGAKKTPGDEKESTVGAKNTPPPGGELPPQDIYSFKNNSKSITAITRPPEIELLDEFCDLHKKGDWNVKVKERTHMKMLLTDGVPLEYIISTMKKIYQRKTEEGERITSFVYYYEPILSAWNELQKGETGHAKDNAARNGHSRRNTTPSISDDELDELQRASNVYLLKVSGYGNDQ